jgi:hypothetical protein
MRADGEVATDQLDGAVQPYLIALTATAGKFRGPLLEFVDEFVGHFA